MAATLPRRRWLANAAAVVAALALGLGAAFVFHATVDNPSASSQSSGVNVRGSLAHALANRDGAVAVASGAPAPISTSPSVDPPSAAPTTPGQAVEMFLALEVAEDFDGSYGLLSQPDRSSTTSRAAWTARHAELPAITGYEIAAVEPHSDRADVSVRLELRPELSVSAGLVPGRASATLTTIAEDGGWRVAFADSTLVPHYAPATRAPAAVRSWARARQSCRRAPEYEAGLLGSPARADALCDAAGAVRTGSVRALPETAQDQAFLAAFGAEVHDWARVVRVEAPVRMDVVVAPVGEQWLVVGVLPALSEPS